MRKASPSAADSTECLPDDSTIGMRLRALRREKSLSLSALSKRSGVPVSTISKIENGQLNLSLVHAINMATALEANLGFLVNQSRATHASYAVVRANQRSRRRFPEMEMALADLNAGFVPGLLEARIGELDPGAQSGENYMTHRGEEFVHVLAGEITYDIEGEVIELQRGDSLHFKSKTPHRWKNPSDNLTTVLWVFSDGLSF